MIGEHIIGLFLNVQLPGLVKVICKQIQFFGSLSQTFYRIISFSTYIKCLGKTNQVSYIFLDHCPDDDTNYALIEGVCYFFENSKMWHSTAQENCNNHIVNGTKGRLFEPRTLETNDFVFSNFTSVHGNQNIFIGIDDINETNKWVYSSSGEQANFTNWQKGQPNSNYAHCVHFWNVHPTLWGDTGCNVNLPSICEF